METAGANTTGGEPGPLDALYGLVEAKVADYDPKADEDEESEFTSTETVGFSTLIGRQANACDKCLLACGCCASALFGVA